MRLILSGAILVCLSSLSSAQDDVPPLTEMDAVMMSWFLPVCDAEPPEGYHYERDEECALDKIHEWMAAYWGAIMASVRAQERADSEYEADVAHAAAARDACIADSGGDPEAIALCQQQYDFEVQTAENDRDAAIEAAQSARDAAIAAARDNFWNTIEDCCDLVQDPVEPEDPEGVGAAESRSTGVNGPEDASHRDHAFAPAEFLRSRSTPMGRGDFLLLVMRAAG